MLIASPKKLVDETAKNQAKAQQEDGVAEGYALDDPELLRMELQDAYNIMDVTRIKLIQYVSILRKYIPGNQVDELHQSLDGLEELTTLLKPKNQLLYEEPPPVDVAVEVGVEEVPMQRKKAAVAQKLSFEAPDPRVSRAINQKMQKNRKEVEMNVIRSSILGCVDSGRYPQEDPAGEGHNMD